MSSRIVSSAQNITSRLWESVCSAVPDVIVTTDEAGKIETCNQAVEDMFGYSVKDAAGMNLTQLIAPPHREDHRARISDYLKSKENTSIRVGRRLEGLRRNGSSFPISITAAEIPGRESRSLTYVIRDITEILHTEAELEKKTQELARSNAELKQFATIVSHDLQAPLRTISVFSRQVVAHCGEYLDDGAKDKLERVVRATDRMRDLVSDLLEFSKVSRSEPNFALVSLTKIFDELTSDLSELIRETSATIIHTNLPTVMGDAGQIRQLFQNLVTNSIKFRRPDMKPIIQIEAAAGPQAYTISVRDNGIGIDPRHSRRIFEVFQRLHSTAEFPGSGVGLAICKKIVEHHGGTIWVESEKEGGSRFCFTLKGKDT